MKYIVHFLPFKHSNVIVFFVCFFLLQTSRNTTLNKFGTAGHGQKAKNGPGWPHEIEVLHSIDEGLVFQSIKLNHNRSSFTKQFPSVFFFSIDFISDFFLIFLWRIYWVCVLIDATRLPIPTQIYLHFIINLFCYFVKH